jgi:regulator of protease activity HflC (stomatin/prohibitin superfamily)
MNPDIYKEVPITIQSVNVDNLDYPRELQSAISRTHELEKQLEQKTTEIEIAKKDKERMVIRARSIAKQQKTIAGTLTEDYITHYAIEAAKKIAASTCPTIVVIPTDPAAPGVPFIRSDKDEDGEPKP